jgi:ATP-dependent helicase/nuclease subunit B
VGSQGDLLEALARSIPLRLYPPDPSEEHGKKVRAHWPWSIDVEILKGTHAPTIPTKGDLSVGALRVLPVNGGPLEELEEVAGHVLELLDRGSTPSQIGIVARTLEPYGSWLGVVLNRYGIPYSSSLSEPVLLYPAARGLLHLARALLGDLEREAVIELMKVCVRGVRGTGRAVKPELAARLAGRAGLVRGRRDWEWALENARELLGREVQSSRADLGELHRVLEALDADAEGARRARGFGEPVQVLLEAAARWIREGDDPAEILALDAARAALRSLVASDAVDALGGAASAPTQGEVLATVEDALSRASMRANAEDRGGVLVLDAIQARGLSFRHMFFIGVNDTFWPRMLDEDPFLPDDIRSRLREELKRPVPVRSDAEAEERFLFHLLLSQAEESVAVSFHKVDALGRASAPSPYLRELIDRAPDVESLREAVYESEPEGGLGSDAVPETLPLRSALIEAALREGTGGLSAVAAAGPADLADAVGKGLDQLAAVESFVATDLRFDAFIGEDPARDTDVFRPTRLEHLGRCPLRAFFSQILRVPELEEGSATEFGSRELGSLVHDVLKDLYPALQGEGLLRLGGDPSKTFEAARTHLDRILRESSPIRALLDRRHRGISEGLVRVVRDAIEDFLEWDLGRLLVEGVEKLSCEEGFEHSVDLGDGPMTVRGKIDRWMELSTGRLRVSDYKTGARHQESVSATEIKKGRALQLPLYVLRIGDEQSAACVEGEVLYVPLRPERLRGQRKERAYALKTDAVAEIRAALGPPVATVRRLLREGCFPFRSGDQCRYCAYRVACRRSHVASLSRVTHAEEFRAYYAMAESER